jgi:hypothetical protein
MIGCNPNECLTDVPVIDSSIPNDNSESEFWCKKWNRPMETPRTNSSDGSFDFCPPFVFCYYGFVLFDGSTEVLYTEVLYCRFEEGPFCAFVCSSLSFCFSAAARSRSLLFVLAACPLCP